VKTLKPLILTARIDKMDLAPFNSLRQQHFPPDRNVLAAHVTIFHRLPGEHLAQIQRFLDDIAVTQAPFFMDVTGVVHFGAGVAFAINSAELDNVHARLRAQFMPWLGGQDLRNWQPHITVQNKVRQQRADALHRRLSQEFVPTKIKVTGVDLWRYISGPWKHEQSTMFLGV